MDSPKQVVFSEQAFLKATLHACQHPTTPVYGALLGRPDGDNLRIEAVVPLFHETPLGPLLEVAMTMIVKVRILRVVCVCVCFGDPRKSEGLHGVVCEPRLRRWCL